MTWYPFGLYFIFNRSSDREFSYQIRLKRVDNRTMIEKKIILCYNILHFYIVRGKL